MTYLQYIMFNLCWITVQSGATYLKLHSYKYTMFQSEMSVRIFYIRQRGEILWIVYYVYIKKQTLNSANKDKDC